MPEAVYFETLKPGDLFLWRTGEMLKTKNMPLMGRFGTLPTAGAGSAFNCFSIEEGEPYFVDDKELVVEIVKKKSIPLARVLSR